MLSEPILFSNADSAAARRLARADQQRVTAPLRRSTATVVLVLAAISNAPAFAQGAAADAGTRSVAVDRILFDGNRAFTSDQLSGLIAAEIGKPMTLEDMRSLATRIQDYYHQAGYRLARVVVPGQEFSSRTAQTLKLQISEGWLGDIVVEGTDRYDKEHVVDALRERGLTDGKPFTLEQVEQALTTLNRQSGIQTTSALRPGKEAGSTDLVVQVTEAPRASGALEVSNYGSKNTGQWRYVPSIKLANLTGRGDELNLLTMRSLGNSNLHYETMSYALPIDSSGTKIGSYYAQGNVDVGREYRILEIEGKNRSWGLGLSHDFVQSAREVYTGDLWFESQNFEQRMLGTTTADDRLRKLRLTLNMDRSDLDGRTLASISLHRGLGNAFGGMENASPESSRAYSQADNSFTKIAFDLVRLQRLNARWMLVPRLSGQYSPDSLVSSEQWAIGGVTSVAGHAPSLYSGDSGYTASVELRYFVLPESDRYQLFTRVDSGGVYVRTPYLGQRSQEHLSGVTFGLQANPIDPLDLRVDLTYPLGNKEKSGSSLYVQARYRF